MLRTALKEGQFVKVGEAIIWAEEISDSAGRKKVRLAIEAPKEVKIQFDKTKRDSS